MAEIDNATQNKNSGPLMTRVPVSIEKDLIDLFKKERRNMSQIISMLLTEYMPVRKKIFANKYLVKDVSLDHGQSILLEKSTEDILMIGLNNNVDQNTYLELPIEKAIELAAGVLTFIIDSQLNG